jgi:hypothetical protein
MSGPCGPYASQQEVQKLPAVRAVYEAFAASPDTGRMAPHNLAIIEDACQAAGVKLGDYDRAILTWLSGWEPSTCAVLAAIIRRASQPQPGLDSETWECTGCHGPFIGRRPADDRCQDCARDVQP